MAIKDFLLEVKNNYNKYGASSIRISIEDLFHGILSRLGYFVNYGDDFYDYEWDLLILLDACRWDLMEEVVDEYEFLETYSSFVGQSSHSSEFLQKTFMQPRCSGVEKFGMWKQVLKEPDNIDLLRDYYQMQEDPKISQTTYITWNMFSEVLDGDAFDDYIALGQKQWGRKDKMLPPRKLTDYTIKRMREEDTNQVIVHYMQPHAPFRNGDGTELSRFVWDRIQCGEKDKEQAWEEYKDNLRWVLDDVELLLENVDAENVVISSDHGNAIGEWGCYGHRQYVPINAMKRVPWVETTAANENTYEPEIENAADANKESIRDLLEALGYA